MAMGMGKHNKASIKLVKPPTHVNTRGTVHTIKPDMEYDVIDVDETLCSRKSSSFGDDAFDMIMKQMKSKEKGLNEWSDPKDTSLDEGCDFNDGQMCPGSSRDFDGFAERINAYAFDGICGNVFNCDCDADEITLEMPKI